MSFSAAHALVIGVGKYQYLADRNVPIAAVDASEVAKTLQNEDLCAYPPTQITLLRDEQATRQHILTELDRLAQTLKPENTLFLFYVGHGHYATDGQYTLTTHDTQVENKRIQKGTGISEPELLEKLRQVKAARVLMVFNACHAGEISPHFDLDAASESFGDAPPPEKLTAALLSTGEGRIIISACRPEQKSWVGSGKVSLFTNALLTGLRGDGMLVQNNQGYISAFSLYEHIYASAKAAAEKLGQEQEPELTVLRGVGPFPVALYKGAQAVGAFDPSTETLPADAATREIDPALSKRVFDQSVRIYQASLTGSGALAQGTGAKAVGQGGILIDGDFTGNLTVGNNNQINNNQG